MPRRGDGRAVCLVRQGYYPAEARIRREAEALEERGYRVDVICLAARDEPRHERFGRIEAHRIPLGRRRAGAGRYVFEYGAFFALVLARLTWLHARRRYVVVQVNTMPDFLVFAAIVPKLLGTPVVLDMQELMPELFAAVFGASERGLAVRSLKALERASVRFADRVVLSTEPQRAIVAERGLPDEKLVVVLNSADERLFRGRRHRRTRRDDEPPLVVAHGTLIEHYGFQTMVRAMPEVRRLVGRARLEIIGDGEYAPVLHRLARELRVADAVDFVGLLPLDDIPARLATADVGVVPNEGQYLRDFAVPTKLIEYVAMGVPAVVPHSCAVEAYFDDSMVRFFEPGDSDGLARAVADLISNREAAITMAERAASAFLPEYGWRQMKKRYVRLVDELASRPS